MSNRFLIVFSAGSLLFAGVGIAETAGNASGPPTNRNVQPSTSIQKEEGRSADESKASGGGAPGIEAKPGTQSGSKNNMNADDKR